MLIIELVAPVKTAVLEFEQKFRSNCRVPLQRIQSISAPWRKIGGSNFAAERTGMNWLMQRLRLSYLPFFAL
jgi:hypothetical protein